MRTEQKRVKLWDGVVSDIMKGANSTQVEIENGRYVKDQGYVKEKLTKRLDNPAQAEGLEIGQKIAIFTDQEGRTNLVRDGEWKASEPCMVTSKKTGKEYDNGVTVIMGRCISAKLVEPKEGQMFAPFFALNVITKDHVLHRITVNNYDNEMDQDNIERTMRNFQYFMPNDKHSDFIPFTGTFLTGKAYKEGEEQRGEYTNVERSYSGLINGKSVISYDYTKYNAPERQSARDNAAQQAAEMDVPPEADDGFMNIPDGIDEELPFN